MELELVYTIYIKDDELFNRALFCFHFHVLGHVIPTIFLLKFFSTDTIRMECDELVTDM